jgi:hypothetical protein
MLRKIIIVLLVITSIQTSFFAQQMRKDTINADLFNIHKVKRDTTPETKGEKKQEYKEYDLYQFAHESYLFVKMPTSWRANDWLKVGVVGAITVGFMPFDQGITNYTRPHQQYYYSVPVVAGRVYGEWYSIGGVSALFAAYGFIVKDDAAKRLSLELFQAGLYAEATTFVLKIGFGRARPIETENSFTYHPFTIFDDHYHSFPSGHTTSAMAMSVVMSRHANSTALKILSFFPVALTIFSRIYQDQHWASDIIPGAAIGYFTGNWVVDLHEGRRHRINVTSVYPPSISIILDMANK